MENKYPDADTQRRCYCSGDISNNELIITFFAKMDCIITVLQSVEKTNMENFLITQEMMKSFLASVESAGSAPAPATEVENCTPAPADVSAPEIPKVKRRVIHIRDLVLAEGDYLMDTVEACDVLGISRVTLVVRREEGLLTKVEIGKKGGGVRYIASEVMEMQQWYSVPKGKV